MAKEPLVWDPDDPPNIEHWRYEELRRHGVPADDATALAKRDDVDLERIRWMIEHGCPPEQVAKIV